MNGIRMQVPAVKGTADALRNEGTQLTASWSQADRAITAGEEGLWGAGGGTDPLLIVFTAAYSPAAQQARAEAAAIPGKFVDLGTAGLDSTERYRTGDGNAANAMPK